MQKMSDRVGYELVEVPDTPPDRLATQECGHLRSYFRARRQRSDCFQRRDGENEKLSSREQDQTVGDKTTLSSHLSAHSGGTSCRLQYRSRRDGFIQKQDHQQCRSSSSKCFHPHQHLCHQSEGLPTESHMETCRMSREDENNRTLNTDELYQTAREEVKRKDKNTTGHAIPAPMQNRKKMLVRNGRISPNGLAADEAMSNKSVKRLRDASVEGLVMNDGAIDANCVDSCDFDFQPNNISLPISAQKEDRRKGKAIVSDDMAERDENECVQLRQRRKRMKTNSSSSGDFNRFSVCRDGTGPWRHGSLYDTSKGNIQSTLMPQGCSRVHQNERQLTRLENTTGDLLPLSSVEHQQNSSEAGSPEVIFMRSCNTTSGHAMPTPMRNQKKMLVRNGRISPNGLAADEAMSNKSVKRLRDASVEGLVMNDGSIDANSIDSCDFDFQPNNISLPISAQKDDRRKGKAIVSDDTAERDENECVQLLQRRKRMRTNSSSSGDINRLSVCRDGTGPWLHGSLGLATQGKSQACRNDVSLNSSRDDASKGNIQSTLKPQNFSRVHQNERQLARLEKARGDLLPLSSLERQGNSSEAGSPEVIFLRSRRPSRRNHFSSCRISNGVQESICDVEVDDRTPIEVDSLESPINETVNLEESNNDASARARQIEQDEILARQLQEEFAGQELEGGLQASFGISGRREPSHSLAIHPPLLPLFLSSHPIVPPHRRRDAVSGRWHRTSGRPFRGSRFRFPSHMNIEMRVDMLEAMEHAVESNVTHRLLSGVQRDFNENDYEMLLALDDDNKNCKGASKRHIDRLPISTVQNDISDEACSICLEMPKCGEAIRHLLCMHKFHKECIDPWLAKQASCPICKLSI